LSADAANQRRTLLFAPVVTVPLMTVGGPPAGMQLMGQQPEDARATGLARWFGENLKRVATPA
jgi:Asp-tRNA(Asn)/Glu-tRNA(Gln) amidotransferase A subunit family amidase